MYSKKLFALVSICFFCCSNIVAASEKTIDSITFLEPSDYQKEVLAQDRPLKSGEIDLENRVIWMIGKHHLWKWSFTAEELQKYSLIDTKRRPNDSLQALYFDEKNQTLWASSRLTLFEVKLKPFKVTAQMVPANIEPTLVLERIELGSKRPLIWVKGKTIYSLMPAAKEGLKAFASLHQNDLKIARLMPGKDGLLLAATKHELFKINLAKPQKDGLVTTSIYRSQPEIKDIIIDHKKAKIVSKHALVLLDDSGNIGQIIPTRQNRELLLTEHSYDNHYYLFDDGLIERFNTKQKSKKSWHLPKTHLQIEPKVLKAVDALLFTLSEDTARLYFLD